MLPPGHLAAGFLVAEAVLKVGQPALSTAQTTNLLLLGTFFGFAPDLDFFYLFAKEKTFEPSGGEATGHRKYLSHAPLLWLLIGLIIILLAPNPYWHYVGLLLWVCSWSHFVLDTIQTGIRWGWPFSDKIFALKDRELKHHIQEEKFIPYWWGVFRFYSTRLALSFYLEIALIIFAVWFIIR